MFGLGGEWSMTHYRKNSFFVLKNQKKADLSIAVQ
jgi:hypothetical protein